MENNNLYPLNTSWCLWYHSIDDTSWDKKSYQLIFTIKDLYDLKLMNNSLKSHHLQNGMFFLMREDIFPTWEDPDNRNGSCLSFKISGSQLLVNWRFIVEKVLTEDILKDLDKSEELLLFPNETLVGAEGDCTPPPPWYEVPAITAS